MVVLTGAPDADQEERSVVFVALPTAADSRNSGMRTLMPITCASKSAAASDLMDACGDKGCASTVSRDT